MGYHGAAAEPVSRRGPKRELASAKHKHFEVLEGLRTRDSTKAKDALQADIAWGELMIDWLEKKENLAEV